MQWWCKYLIHFAPGATLIKDRVMKLFLKFQYHATLGFWDIRNWRMKSTFCMAKWFADNRPISQMPECTCSVSHNAPFLFWMEHCGIWNRVILVFVNQVNSMKAAETQINSLEVYYPGVAELVDYPGRRVIYSSFIASNFNYCPLLWFSRAEKVNKIDRIREGTLRFVFKDHTSNYNNHRTKIRISFI